MGACKFESLRLAAWEACAASHMLFAHLTLRLLDQLHQLGLECTYSISPTCLLCMELHVGNTLTVAALSVYLRKVYDMLLILKHEEMATFCSTKQCLPG
jgi:hypothetical protein